VVLTADAVTAAISALRLPGAPQSRTRISYFSEFQVLLAAGAERHILGELEAAVDAVERRQRRGEHQPHEERGAPALLQILVEDVRRVREEVAAEVFCQLGLRELGQVLGELRRGCFAR